MRRGCIAVGLIKCDICGKIIEHGDRYLILEEETEPKQRVCLTCCEKQRYGRYEIEKGEKIFTLLVDEVGQMPEKKKSEKKAAEKAPVEAKPKAEARSKAATGPKAEAKPNVEAKKGKVAPKKKVAAKTAVKAKAKPKARKKGASK
jgi:hypothetical protein